MTGTAPLYDHDNEKYVSEASAPVCVDYKVAKDEDMKKVVTKGTAYTSYEVDYTLKVIWRTTFAHFD